MYEFLLAVHLVLAVFAVGPLVHAATTAGRGIRTGNQAGFLTYTIDWTKDRIQLFVNGDMVRNIPAGVAGEYPQTPSRVQFGVWCGGCSDQPGTVEWAGGKPTWDEG